MDFPTKAALKKHFQKVHPGHNNNELGSAEIPLPEDFVENIDVKRIVRQAGSNPMFACELNDGTITWRYIPLEKPIVRRFLQGRKPETSLPLADMESWAQGFVLVS